MSEEGTTLVIDIGSLYTKAGRGGEGKPLNFYQSFVNRIYNKKFYGEAVWRPDLEQTRPIERGKLLSTGAIYDILHKELDDPIFNGEARTVLIAESNLFSVDHQHILAKEVLLFMELDRVCFVNQGVLSLLASGRSTGIAVEIGDGVTQIVPVYEGCPIRHAMETQNFGGKDITEFLNSSLFREERHEFVSVPSHSAIRRIKEEKCYVALDFEEKSSKSSSSEKISYELPDKTYIDLAEKPLFTCPEALFQPSLFNRGDFLGVHELCHKAIKKCDPSLHKELYENIIVSGGSTMFKGFTERMEKEMKMLASSTGRASYVKVIEAPKREYSAWLGGSILSSNPAFDAMCLTREEYDEEGWRSIKGRFI